MNILLIGSDTRGTDYTYGLFGCLMRVVRVDFVKPGVTMLDSQRDLWVENPLSLIGISMDRDYEKLNQAYLYGKPRRWLILGDPSAWPGLLAAPRSMSISASTWITYLAVT